MLCPLSRTTTLYFAANSAASFIRPLSSDGTFSPHRRSISTGCGVIIILPRFFGTSAKMPVFSDRVFNPSASITHGISVFKTVFKSSAAPSPRPIPGPIATASHRFRYGSICFAAFAEKVIFKSSGCSSQSSGKVITSVSFAAATG